MKGQREGLALTIRAQGSTTPALRIAGGGGLGAQMAAERKETYLARLAWNLLVALYFEP